MPTSAAGNKPRFRLLRPARRLPAAGFTLLELMVVLAIIAVGMGAVSLALPDSQAKLLQREGDRLAALLEAARAQSRAAGVPVVWQAQANGFVWRGLPPGGTPLPTQWLHAGTRTEGPAQLRLGPDPVIGPQSVVLRSGNPEHSTRLHVSTDGLRPFAVHTP